MAGLLLLAFTVSSSEVERSNRLAKKWLFSNLRDKGLFVYLYDPVKDIISTQNNELRQLMASRILAQESQKDSSLLDKHTKNLEFIMKFWYKTDKDLGYVFYDDKSKIGANAMLLRVLVGSPLYQDYKTQGEEVARGILSLQNPDGSFRPWLIEPSYEYKSDYLLTFYSGEAIVALLEYYEKTLNPEILQAAIRSQNYYIEKYVTHLTENYYPAYVPWHTIALNKLFKITGDTKYAQAAFTLNDKLLELQDTQNYVGRFYNPVTPQYGSPHSSSDAVYTDGLAYAYELAAWTGDTEHQNRYLTAIKLALGNLLGLQYKEPVTEYSGQAYKYLGAIKISVDNPSVRVDTTQHTIDALDKILELNVALE